MKLLSEKTIGIKAQEHCEDETTKRASKFRDINEQIWFAGACKISFIKGCNIAESLLLPKMIEFAEWLPKGKVLTSYSEGDKLKHYTTSELLDIWIEQNKHN